MISLILNSSASFVLISPDKLILGLPLLSLTMFTFAKSSYFLPVALTIASLTAQRDETKFVLRY